MTIESIIGAIIVIGLLFFAAGHIPIEPPWLKTVFTLLVVLLAIGILIGAVPMPHFG